MERIRASIDSHVGKQESDARVFEATQPHEFPYHFGWIGLPIIQDSRCITAARELMWSSNWTL